VSTAAVEAVELFDGCGQREYVVLAQRQSSFVRVILRLPGQGLAGGIELDVTAQDIADRTLANEVGHAAGAGEVKVGVVDQQSARHEEVAGEQQSCVVVVVDDVGGTVARRRNDVDGSSAQIDLGMAVGPVGESEILFHAVEVVANNLNIGQVGELHIAGPMIEMAMAMHHQQRQLALALRRE
jgi:hypothetical protein